MLEKLTTTKIVLILLGSLVVGIILGNVLPPFKTWFAPAAPKPDCKTANGKDGIKDASGNCVEISNTGRQNVCTAWGGEGNPCPASFGVKGTLYITSRGLCGCQVSE